MSKHTRRYLLLVASALLLVATVPVLRASGPDLSVIDAVKQRDQKALATLLRSKVDINANEPDGATALAWAVHLGEREMADALLHAGANPNTSDGYGETPLTLACSNGDGMMPARGQAANALPHAPAVRPACGGVVRRVATQTKDLCLAIAQASRERFISPSRGLYGPFPDGNSQSSGGGL